MSSDLPVRRLTVTAQMQTPSRRWPLPSSIDGSDMGSGVGFDIPPLGGVDAIVSRPLEEVGQHILRVEVGYGGDSTGGSKTLRKFYRFNVTSPLHIRELTVRSGDASCFVSIAVENATTPPGGGAPAAAGGLTICSAEFQPPSGLVAYRVGGGNPALSKGGPPPTEGGDEEEVEILYRKDGTRRRGRRRHGIGTKLFDGCCRLDPGASYRYLFRIEASSEIATLRGIACGDELGKAVFTWRKAMGETGRIASSSVLCPQSSPPRIGSGAASSVPSVAAGRLPNQLPSSAADAGFVVHGSGISVDAAAAAANRNASLTSSEGGGALQPALDELLPVTVEPIDPPCRMDLACPTEVQFLIVNHSNRSMNLQLQLRLPEMSGVVVCGPSFKNLGEIPPGGGSSVVGVRLVALVAGLFRVQGCCVVDLTSGREIPQPPLFNAFVERQAEEKEL